MHEVSIALGIKDELTRLAREHRAQKVVAVNLKIGRMSGIVIDSLKFAFEAVKLESPLLSATELRIEEVPLSYKCRNCGITFVTDDLFCPGCTSCESSRLRIVSGEEMDIRNVELEEQ